jgi:PPM family protein phosphatase
MHDSFESDPTDEPYSASNAFPQPFSSLIKVDMYGLSDPGHVRTNNEDHFLIVRGGRALETVLSNITEKSAPGLFEETAYGFVVADGLGGQAAGEVASREAIYTLLSLALHTPDWQVRWGAKERNTVAWRMQDRFRRVNAALLQQAAAHASLNGMSTTLTAAVKHGSDLIVGHVGDSRAYLLHQGKLKKLTRDHTLAEHLIDDGVHAPDDHLVLELRNILLQALGSAPSECRPEVHEHLIADGDQLLLCTDGLTEMVAEDLLESVLIEAASAKLACRSLVDLALSNGGRDNVTVIVARFSIPPNSMHATVTGERKGL